MKDQHEVWETNYAHSADLRPREPSEFAIESAQRLKPGSRVLELGCGIGTDAAYFAGAGHEVLALDFSRWAIDKARKRHEALIRTGCLAFDVAVMAQPLRVAEAYDLVYARLSLHYFSDTRTRALFGEIAGLLTPGGLVAFMCKSVEDPLYGKGTEIEPDVFDHRHTRHFFSEAYARECLAPYFEIVELQHIHGLLYGSESAYIKAVARRASET